jgi:hypothetical protein
VQNLFVQFFLVTKKQAVPGSESLPIWTILPAKSSFYSERLTVDILTIGLTVHECAAYSDSIANPLFLILWHVPCSKKEDDPMDPILCVVSCLELYTSIGLITEFTTQRTVEALNYF